MAIELTKKMYDQLENVCFEEGKHSSFKLYPYRGEPCLIKKFQSRREQDQAYLEKQALRLLATPFVVGSAYPLESVKVDEKMIGYLCPFFPESFSHSYVTTTSFPVYSFEERKKSVLDTTEQLKAFHQAGFILNDVRLSNHLIDRKGGHLVDFEDSIWQEDLSYLPPALIHFYHEEKGVQIPNLPSMVEDMRKQLLSHLSLLLNTNLEYYVYCMRENASSLLSSFSFDKGLYEMVEAMFFSNELPYFDAYIECFQDQEQLKRFGKRLHKNLKRKIK